MKIRPYFELNCKNESFVKMHNILESKGIKNNLFMLAIYNKDLIGIDPYDSNLTDDQKRDIIDECKINIWYFLRNVLKVYENPFILNLNSMAQIYLYLQNSSSWNTTHRQSFKKGVCYAISLFERIFHKRSSKFIIARYNKIDFNLPGYIEMDIESVKDREDDIVFIFDAEFTNLKTININLVKGELDKIPNMIIMAESVISDYAESNGVMETLSHSIVWEDRFYDLPVSELKTETLYHIKYSYKELGYDEEWFERMCEFLGNDPEIIRREILLKRRES